MYEKLFLASEVQRRFGAAKELGHLAQMVADGRLHPRIDVEASWTEIAEVAQRFLKRQIAGKAVLHVSQ